MELQPGEAILREERIHAGVFAPPAVLLVVLLVAMLPELWFANMFMGAFGRSAWPMAAVFLVPVVLLGLVGFIPALISYRASLITLTNRRLVYQIGFLFRASGDVGLENIESIFILEPLLGRLTGYGTITVTTTGGAAFPLRFIPKPQVFHAVLQRAVAEAKRPARPVARAVAEAHDDSRYMPKWYPDAGRRPAAG
jgi:uncharacterized membrane protein YdbT with pleckstrin-like domain